MIIKICILLIASVNTNYNVTEYENIPDDAYFEKIKYKWSNIYDTILYSNKLYFMNNFYKNFVNYEERFQNNNFIFGMHDRALVTVSGSNIEECNLNQKCGRCDNSTKLCSACTDGMILSDDNTSCYRPYSIPYCDNYESEPFCSSCKFDYYLDYTKSSCIKQQENIKECHSSCSKCVETDANTKNTPKNLQWLFP